MILGLTADKDTAFRGFFTKKKGFNGVVSKKIVIFTSPKDSMVIVPLSTGQIANRNVFVPKKIGVEMLTDTKRTLIF
jgi:hypothetical protein